MNIQDNLLTPNPYSRCQRPLNEIRAVAIHYVGNPNTSALANRNYFNNLKDTHATYASSHYIIGLQGEIIRCIPENEVSFCTNQANDYTLSIENCHPEYFGEFTSATYNSLVELCADICKRYNLNPLNGGLVRHYDVTGKICPRWFVDKPQAWENFKKDVDLKMKGLYKDMSVTVMTPNATIQVAPENSANTYADENIKIASGSVWNNERVQFLQGGAKRSLIRYNLDSGGTKEAWVTNTWIVKDPVIQPPIIQPPATDYKALYDSAISELNTTKAVMQTYLDKSTFLEKQVDDLTAKLEAKQNAFKILSE